ncbi:uncharacterized protein ACNLHF_026402 [Anomaloglossus baeobatrachus]|uniref:uncharacterized protein LOC142246576 n=1 Tax=Anomaloglossus baeobatrachus TaxID=238106 RepID=UPI003F507ADE
MKISKGSHSLYGTSRNPSNNYDDPREPEIMKNRKGISATHPISSKDSRRVSERPAASDVFDTSQRHPSARRRVGIFSRSTDRDYRWLVETLRSEDFSSLVANVKSCFIHNKQPFQKFLDDINQCTFGILYHSKNRGRVNVTDVTDSLYDQELETLCMILGKKNVVVIIDDLEDSSDYRKRYVLQEQPRIVKQAADLLLVSDDDKMDSGLLRRKTDQLKKLLRDAAPGSDLSSCV